MIIRIDVSAEMKRETMGDLPLTHGFLEGRNDGRNEDCVRKEGCSYRFKYAGIVP